MNGKGQTQVTIGYMELQGLTLQSEDLVITEMMSLMHDSGGVIDRLSKNGFLIYWSSDKGSFDGIRNAITSLSRIQKCASELNRVLAKRRGSSPFRIKASLTSQILHEADWMATSAVGRARVLQRAKHAFELCAQNGFLGTDLLMDQETSDQINSWFPTELAGRARLKTSELPVALFRLCPINRERDCSHISRREKAGQIVISHTSESIQDRVEDVVVSRY